MADELDEILNVEMRADTYLETRLKDAGFVFAHNVANVFFAASEFLDLYKETQNPEYLSSVQSAVNEFYSKLDVLKESMQSGSMPPKGKITPENLEGFDKYKNIGFSEDNAEEAISGITALITWLKS